MNTTPETTCPSCGTTISSTAYFCPNCGKKLKGGGPLATSLSTQIKIYAVSLLIPPFGLWYVWKYMRQPNAKSKKIGMAAVVLTIISIIITIQMTRGFVDSLNQSINELNNLDLNNLNF